MIDCIFENRQSQGVSPQFALRQRKMATEPGGFPRYFLFAESELESFRDQVLGRWRFVLQLAGSNDRFDATDWEPGISQERLQLLTVIRGLEELDQPAAVTIITPSSYVIHGISFGLKEWRQNNWLWERFGDMVPITNDDLWRRFDRAGQFHQIACRQWKVGESFLENVGPESNSSPATVAKSRPRNRAARGFASRWAQRISRIASSIVSV